MAGVLVTGSSGFLGRALTRSLLADAHMVCGVDPLIRPGASFVQHQDDLGSSENVKTILRESQIDSVVHAGGVSGPKVAPDAPARVCKSNIVASMNLFDACRTAGVRRIVSISSAAALGSMECDIVPDHARYRPGDIYGASKAAVELLLSAYAAEFGLSATSLRMPTLYGPGMPASNFIAAMIKAAKQGDPYALSWGSGYSCPYLFIDDAVAAIVAALKAPTLKQPVYNISGAEFVATETIVSLIADRFPSAKITISPGPPMQGYRRAPMDISAAWRDLNFRPRVGIKEGVRRCIDNVETFH